MINTIEFFEITKHYPIVFTQSESPLPVAIMGLEQHNYFVNTKGVWKQAAYIPAYVRKYPFIFMDVPERKEFLLCVDEASPQFQETASTQAISLFKDNSPSDMARNALEFCVAYHNHHQMTRQFCQDIFDAGLLVPMRSDVKLAGGREIQLGGFMAIDENKVKSLPDATILEFFKKGWLPFIYATLTSTVNWKQLVDMASEDPLRAH